MSIRGSVNYIDGKKREIKELPEDKRIYGTEG